MILLNFNLNGLDGVGNVFVGLGICLVAITLLFFVLKQFYKKKGLNFLLGLLGLLCLAMAFFYFQREMRLYTMGTSLSITGVSALVRSVI